MIEYALCNLAPGSLWVIHNNSYEGIEWLSTDITKPTKEQVDAEVARLQAEYDNKQYQRDRALEYPSLPEQLDMLYHDKINNTNVWLETIQAVKDKYPKS